MCSSAHPIAISPYSCVTVIPKVAQAEDRAETNNKGSTYTSSWGLAPLGILFAALHCIEMELFVSLIHLLTFYLQVLSIFNMEELLNISTRYSLLTQILMKIGSTATATIPAVYFISIQFLSPSIWSCEVSLLDQKLQSKHLQFLIEDRNSLTEHINIPHFLLM